MGPGRRYWDGKCGPYSEGIYKVGLAIRLHKAKEVYVIRNGSKCSVPNADTFFSLGLDFDNVVVLGKEEFFPIPTGPAIPPV